MTKTKAKPTRQRLSQALQDKDQSQPPHQQSLDQQNVRHQDLYPGGGRRRPARARL